MNLQISRRNFLKTSATVGAGIGLVGLGGSRLLAGDLLAQGAPNAEKLGWLLGCQAFSFNRFTFFDAIDKTASLGLKYIEAYPGQKLSKAAPKATVGPELSPGLRKAIRQRLADKGLKLINFGVCKLPDPEQNRKVFDFAKEMGIETIVSEPNVKALGGIDKLCEEYGINLAIHNHAKPTPYWDPEIVLKALEGRSKRIGACADTGHWVRSALDPIECLKKLEGRIISLHLKDLDKKGPIDPKTPKDERPHDVPWGTGVCDVKGILTELQRQGFKGVFSIEYEYHWDNSLPEIAECVKYFDKTAAELSTATQHSFHQPMQRGMRRFARRRS